MTSHRTHKPGMQRSNVEITRTQRLGIALAVLLGACISVAARSGDKLVTLRASISPNSVPGNDYSGFFGSSISGNGRFIAFRSLAENLVQDDSNNLADIFVRDVLNGTTVRVSVSSSGVQSNGHSYDPSISADGRYVAFISSATNLVAGVTQLQQVYVRDLEAGTTRLVSMSSDGTFGNSLCFDAQISANGQYVSFVSSADNLVPGDTNNLADTFVRSLQTNTTARISLNSNGTQLLFGSVETSISGDGRYVACTVYPSLNRWHIFVYDRNQGLLHTVFDVNQPFLSANGRFLVFRSTGLGSLPYGNIYRLDVQTAALDLVTAGQNGYCEFPTVSADGRLVAFDSDATNLVSGDTNDSVDCFVRDMQLGVTTRVSLGAGGLQANDRSDFASISGDGRYVGFISLADNLDEADTNGFDDVFRRDCSAGTTGRVSVATTGSSLQSCLSANGRFIAYESLCPNMVSGDLNNAGDIFIRDLVAGTTTIVSVDSNGIFGNADSYWPSVSSDGRYVAFWSDSTNLVAGDTNGLPDVFVHDTATGQTTRVSVTTGGAQATGPTGSFSPSLSSDGRYVVFISYCGNLAPGGVNGVSHVYVRDRQTNQTTLASVSTSGATANLHSYAPCISSDGRYVEFVSTASNLTPADTDNGADIFVRDRQTGQTVLVSVSSSGTHANNTSNAGVMSSDGRYVAFRSFATNLVAGDTNGLQDIFVHDNVTGMTSRVSISSTGVQADAQCDEVCISPSGRYVGYSSVATNLVAGDTNGTSDIFVRDLQSASTTRVSVGNGGSQSNGDSYLPSACDVGPYFGFYSSADNLVFADFNFANDVFVRGPARLTKRGP